MTTTRLRRLQKGPARSSGSGDRRAPGCAPRSRGPSLIDLPNFGRENRTRRIVIAALVGLSFSIAPRSSAQVALAIDGYGLTGPASALSGETLYGTKQGQIYVVNADTGAWSMLAVGVSLQPYNSEDPEYPQYLQLITAYPWLVSSPVPVAASLGSTSHADSIVGLVDPADLISAAAAQLLVRSQDLASQVRACVDPQAPDPDEVKSHGQAILLGETGVKWRSKYPTWSGVGMEEYWLPTYARPALGEEDFTNVHWYRLMESACINAVGYQETIAFTRGADVVIAASLGLYLHVQAVTLQGNPPSVPTADPETTPGLENVTAANLPRFKVSLPITIAIPYTPPFLPGQYVPYEAGVVNIAAAPGAVMTAAIGVTTSATHAVFPSGAKYAKTPLYRFLPGGSLTIFIVPPDATAGYVEFHDLKGEDEAALMPIKGFSYTPPEELQNSDDSELKTG